MANGAGDVITAIVESGTDEGISYNIGSLFGAGLFCSTITISLTILQSDKALPVTQMTIYRDVSFYLLATFLTVGFAIYGKLTVITSILFICLYVALVIIVYLQSSTEKKRS